MFKLMDSSSILSKLTMYAGVLDIRSRNVILGFFWLIENRLLVDTQYSDLRNVNSGHVISCYVRWTIEVFIMEEEPVEDGKILLIIDTSEGCSWYAESFSAERASRLHEQKS